VKKLLKISITLIFFFLAVNHGFCQTSDVTSLKRYNLENGLELFVLENHVVPLVRIQITVRCGAIAQSAETAGLFHLYEHMMFKGNKMNKTQSEFQASMRGIGVANWNGGTSTESVSYHFTVSSEKIEKGVEFWANAIQFPLLNPGELKIEKNVVIDEIRGYFDDPNNIYLSAIDKALFFKFPWRRDVAGYEKAVRNATPDILRHIQNTYYIPNNTALFIGGDVNPDKVVQMVKKYFGDWQRKKDPWATPLESHPFLKNDVQLIYPDEQMFKGISSVNLVFRGPDLLMDTHATYAADVWGKILDDPNGKFKTNMFARVPGLYKKEDLRVDYFSQRDGGVINFSTYMLLIPGKSTLERIVDLKEAFLAEVESMRSDPTYFSEKDYETLKVRLIDEKILERETTEGFINQLSFWWSSANTEYYLEYIDNLKKIGFADINKFLTDYITTRKSVLSVRMNPQNFQSEKKSAEKLGFAVISKEKAFWWGDKF
jgi:zinc protease